MHRNTARRGQPPYFATKAEARAAEAAHKAELKKVKKGPTPTDTDFRTVANDYLDFCHRRFSVKNYKEKVFIFKTFATHIGATRPLVSIKGLDIIDYLGTRPTNENWNKHRKSLCALFQWAFKHGMVAVNPCLYVDSMPESPKRKVIPSQEEMVKILLASGEHRPFFMALYALAARRGEINNLRWEDVNFEKREVVLWTKKGRTGEMRAQKKPMNQEVYDVLIRLYNNKSGTWVFPNPETGLPYRNRRAQIRMACRTANVPYYPWHSIRHYVASMLSDICKASLPTIQKMLGHTQVSTTSRYIQSLGDDVVEAADMLQIGSKLPSETPMKKDDAV